MLAVFGASLLTYIVIVSGSENNDPISIHLSINARNRNIEVNWINSFPNGSDNTLLILNAPAPKLQLEEFSFNYNGETYFNTRWKTGEGPNVEVLFQTGLDGTDGRIVTDLFFDYLIYEIDYDTKCYAFWFYYMTNNSEILQEGCISAYPKWMNEIREDIKDSRFRNLFIPGSHDSPGYRTNFKELANETRVSKYSYTQDDDIKSQLMHGIRYIDIRVGFYRGTDKKFFANHGIARLHPLADILQQVKDFVEATNEIVVIDFQEFPVGFRKDLSIHQQLVNFLHKELGEFAADPSLSWQASLEDIWRQGKNIIIGYDHEAIATEFDNLLWRSVRHRWGNVQTLEGLEKFLKFSRKETEFNFASRPYAEMAELTPKPLDVILDTNGGLRKMADRINNKISKLYSGAFGQGANFVACDFYRSTNIVESAIYWNKKKNMRMRTFQ